MAMGEYKFAGDTLYVDGGTANSFSIGVTTTAGNTWYPYDTQTVPTGGWDHVTFPSYPPFQDDKIDELEKEIKKLKKHLKKKEKNMKTLYEITVVDVDGNVVIDGKKVVASDKEEASFAADIHATLKLKHLLPKDVTIITRELGQVKTRPEKKRVVVEKE
jgi:hypothetical protein